MAQKTEVVAMLLAGGQGSRLGVLTKNIAKPAVPYGGNYRIIDFPLSNCVNSGIYTVGVLTQYQPLELNDYLGNGQPWDLDRQNGGIHILSPYEAIGGAEWYKGTANAIYQKDAKQIASECLENGLLVLTAKTKIRLLPALNISYLELDRGLKILKEVIEK